MLCFLRFILMVALVFSEVQGAPFAPIRFLERQAPLTNSEVKSAMDLTSVLGSEDLVVGISVNDEARAYPLNAITRPPREIINDTVGETPIAMTWCSRCHDAVVFLR